MTARGFLPAVCSSLQIVQAESVLLDKCVFPARLGRSLDLVPLNISEQVPIDRIPNNLRMRLPFSSPQIIHVFQTQPFAMASFPPFNPPPTPIRIVRRIGRERRAVAAELVAGRILIERIQVKRNTEPVEEPAIYRVRRKQATGNSATTLHPGS